MKFNQLGRFLALCLLAAANAPASILYVDVSNTSPAPPFTNWATAATDIQAAVDAAVPGDQILVTNGIYQTGGRAVFGAMTNRVAVDKPVAVQSVNGPQVTLIQGYQMPGTTNGPAAIRCLYLTNGASIAGFTLTNGATIDYPGGSTPEELNGGGVYCAASTAVLSNCVLSGNVAFDNGGASFRGTVRNSILEGNQAMDGSGGGAYTGVYEGCTFKGNSALAGGGAASCTLRNCTVITNLADDYGGGAAFGSLTNCIVRGNKADEGGGVLGSTLGNCMIASNTASEIGGGAENCTLNNCTLSGNTALRGGGAIFGALNHCTVMDNVAEAEGGGIWNGTARDCILAGNLAAGSDFYLGKGGGAYLGSLTNCIFTGNVAQYGGGAYAAEIVNCTLTGNSASEWGGGVAGESVGEAMVCNSIVCSNTSAQGEFWANYGDHTTFDYCCTVPLPTGGAGNITNTPGFVDLEGANLRLQSNSPCINSGSNAFVSAVVDLDGRPRIVNGTVDMGAYEFQPGVSGVFLAWLQQYGLSTDGSADYSDSDSDRMNNWQEWVAGTIPTNALSVLQLSAPAGDPSGVVVTWQSVTNRAYFLQRSINLGANPAFFTLATNLAGQPLTTSYIDTNIIGNGRFFYRVGVQ